MKHVLCLLFALSIYLYSNISNAFFTIFVAQSQSRVFVVFYRPFFLAELTEIVCASLLNSILATYKIIFLKNLMKLFPSFKNGNVKFLFCLIKKMIKNLLFNETKKILCTFLRLYVKVTFTLASAMKSNTATISLKTKCGKKILCFSH